VVHLQGSEVGVDAEQVDDLQGAEDVGRGEEALRYKLGVEVGPLLPRDRRRVAVLLYLIPLLDVGGHAENHRRDVEGVPREVDEIPEVAQVRPQSVRINLRELFRLVGSPLFQFGTASRSGKSPHFLSHCSHLRKLNR
jgi:hypothetical protein